MTRENTAVSDTEITRKEYRNFRKTLFIISDQMDMLRGLGIGLELKEAIVGLFTLTTLMGNLDVPPEWKHD